MESKSTAVLEVLDCRIDEENCIKLFNNAYEYILYNDTPSFLELLDYRMNLKDLNVTVTLSEDYLIFKFMLGLMLKRHPRKLLMLLPVSPNKIIKIRINNKIFSHSLLPGTNIA